MKNLRPLSRKSVMANGRVPIPECVNPTGAPFASTEIQHWRLLAKGTVQGVGFRPFVFRLAQSLGLKGKVCNSSSGVKIDLEGDTKNLVRFIELLRAQKPTAANITDIEREILPLQSYPDF